jgi:phosphate transport system substrate-binding protein
VLRVVGTGAMNPLVAQLAAAHNARKPALAVVVEPAVGSGGGVRAAADGAVDLGMVSRPLRAEEQRWGLVVTPVALDAVVVAAHRAFQPDRVTREELLDLYRGGVEVLADGTPVTVFLREREESANAALGAWVPGFLGVMDELYGSRRWRVLYHEDSLAESIAITRGSLGVLSLGAVVASGGSLKPLAVDGVTPSVAALASNTWGAVRELALVSRPDRVGRAAAFLAFMESQDGRKVTESCGHVPLPRRGAP